MSQIKVLICIADQKIAAELVVLLNEKSILSRAILDGSMANYAASNEAFNMLVTESKLPSMGGFQILNNARRGDHNKNIMSVFMIDPADQETLDKVKLLKHIAVVKKTASAHEIASKIAELIDNRQNPFKYDVKIINVFIESAAEILEHYFKQKPEFGKTYIRSPDAARKGEITGLIGMTGEGFQGSLALNVTREFCTALGAILFEGQSLQVDDSLASDLCGEICNQIVGKVKLRFGGMGIKALIGLPEVIIGKGHKLIHKVKNPILTIPIKINSYECEFEFCLDKADIKIEEKQTDLGPASSVMLF